MLGKINILDVLIENDVLLRRIDGASGKQIKKITGRYNQSGEIHKKRINRIDKNGI